MQRSTRKFSLCFLFLSIVFLHLTSAQQWTLFSAGNEVKALVVEQEYYWVATTNGLVKIHSETDEKQIYNTLNSDLPTNYILSLAIDQNGVKWIGTTEGLVTFDGTEWTNYEIPDLPTYVDDISAITIDSEDVKWMGIAGRLVRFDDTNWVIYDTTNSPLSGSIISTIALDGDEDIWIGTLPASSSSNNSIYQFNHNSWVEFHEQNSNLPSNKVFDIVIDAMDVKWIGTERGLARLENGAIETFAASNDVVLSVAIDAQGHKWLGHPSGALLYYDDEAWEEIVIPFQNGTYEGPSCNLPQGAFNATVILPEADNNFLIGTNLGGLWKYLDGELSPVLLGSANLPAEIINGVTIDESGNKWLALARGGLVKYDDAQWTTYNSANSMLSGNCLRSVTTSGEGQIWMATSGSVAHLNDDTWEEYDYDDILALGAETVFVEDTNKIWAGLMDGVGFFNGVSWTLYDESNSPLLSDRPVYTIACEQNGKKWFGSTSGLVLTFHEGEWETFDHTNSIIPEGVPIRDIVIDENNVKWIGTGWEGLISVDGTEWTHYTTTNSGLPGRQVHALEIDNENAVWVGTLNDGLAKFDGLNWEVFNRNNSDLPSNHIRDIAIDDMGIKWLATGFGLTKMVECKNITEASIWLEDDTLLATPGATEYQWIDCETDTPIDGATGPNLTLTANGIYAVQIIDGLCSLMSDCITIDHISSVNGVHLEAGISVYPNPFTDFVRIRLDQLSNKTLEISVKNALGQQVYHQQTMVATDLDIPIAGQAGLYWLEIRIENHLIVKKIVKQ